MKITVKFFSSLMDYLPPEAENNSVVLEESATVTPLQIVERFNVPAGEIRTMMKNGTFLPEQDRNAPLEDGDTLTVWPAIQGG